MAGDPPDDPTDPFEGIEDLIETSPPPAAEERSEFIRIWNANAISSFLVIDPAPVERDRLLHELRRSLSATDPLEGPAIVSRIEATMLARAETPPLLGACPHCGCALRALDRPREKPLDPSERAGLLATASRSLRETRADAASLAALARELARRDIVLFREEGTPCPLCLNTVRWPPDR